MSRSLEQIDVKAINRYLDYLVDKYELGKKSLLNCWIALSALWTWAEGELKTKHVIRDYVDRPRPQKPIIKPYTHGDIKAILDACDWYEGYAPTTSSTVRASRDCAIRDKAMILIMVDSGLRVSEVCDLLISDYEPKRGQLLIRHVMSVKALILAQRSVLFVTIQIGRVLLLSIHLRFLPLRSTTNSRTNHTTGVLRKATIVKEGS